MILHDGRWSALDKRIVLQFRCHRSLFLFDPGNFFIQPLALVGQIEYAAAYSFKYSPRPGTPAAEMQETVSTADMDERLVRLQNLIDSQQSAFNRTALGRTVDVLFERAGRKPGQIAGRTPYLQPAHVMHPTPSSDRCYP